MQPELDAIQKDAVIRVLPYGAITKGEQGRELADLDAMAPYVVAFSDDGKGVQDREHDAPRRCWRPSASAS